LNEQDLRWRNIARNHRTGFAALLQQLRQDFKC
jgi:RNA recognition motif-containing protein